jgi:DNA-directed RNA polymerase specialized sigma24 family protein
MAVNAEAPADRLRRLFADTEHELLAYVLRRVDRGEDAADVVAETFLVAWRRMDRVPEGDEARLWLYGVARRQLANQRRGELRRSRLAERLRAELPVALASARGPEDHRVAAVQAALAPDDIYSVEAQVHRASPALGVLGKHYADAVA